MQQQQHLREQYDTTDGNPDNLNATEGEEILPSTNNYVDDEEYGQEEMPRSQKPTTMLLMTTMTMMGFMI